MSLDFPAMLLRRLVHSRGQRATFGRFAAVGGTIAVIDVGLLYALKDLPGFNVYTARLVSYAAAMIAGYLLNRHFTFRHTERHRSLHHELARFLAVHALGGLVNYGVFFLIVRAGQQAGLGGLAATLLPLVAVWAGGLVGMTLNFLLARRWVFDRRRAG